MTYRHIQIKKALWQPFFAAILAVPALCAQDAQTQENVNRLLRIEPLPMPVSAEETPAAQTGRIKFSESRDFVLECRMRGFSEADYARAVSALFRDFEKSVGKKMGRGEKGRVGLKIYSNSGAGLTTPPALVDAVITQLERRGYRKEEIVLVDLERRKLREAGFLPRLSSVRSGGAADDYKGSPAADLQSGKYYDKLWFYDSSLPPKIPLSQLKDDKIYDPELRKSMLPVPLFATFDFWINLPAVTDMESLGVSGAVANVSIWNVSNHERFLREPQNAAVAAAEIAAVPEMRDGYLFTIMSFERMQVAGGSIFNSGATASEPFIFLSSDIVVLDAIAWNFLNRHRGQRGFEPISPMPQVLDNCRQLGLGNPDMSLHKRVFVNAR